MFKNPFRRDPWIAELAAELLANPRHFGVRFQDDEEEVIVIDAVEGWLNYWKLRVCISAERLVVNDAFGDIDLSLRDRWLLRRALRGWLLRQIPTGAVLWQS